MKILGRRSCSAFVLVALLGLAACSANRGATRVARASEGFAVADDGTRLYYRVTGGGGRDTLIVPLAVWLAPELEPLARDRTVIFYDPRGRGRSDTVTDTARLGLDADLSDLEAIRRHFGVRRFSLLGWSYFGAMTAHYAMRYPEHVTRLVQLHPIPPRRDPFNDQDMAERRRRGDARSWERLQQMQREKLPDRDPVTYCQESNRFFIALQVADSSALSRLKVDPCTLENERPANFARLLARAPATRPYDWRESMAELRMPTLVIHGEKDPIPLAGSREWAARPEARLLVIPAAGHLSFVEQPDLLFPAVDRFLRGSWPADAEQLAVSTVQAQRTGFADVNGTRLYYEMQGKGDPVVLLQGGQLPLEMWDPQFDEFARYFRVIRYDARGFGRSGAKRGPYAYHEDLYALLRHLNVRRASLVGLSLGGRVAVDFALEHPDMVQELVLAGPGLSGFDWRSPPEPWLDSARAAARAGDSVKVALLWLESGYMKPVMRDSALAARLRILSARNASLWMQPDSERVLTPPAIGRLQTIKKPTLLILGSLDVVDIRVIVDTLAHSIPSARKVVIETAGHMVNMERPVEFNRLVLDFLRSRKAAAPQRQPNN